MDYDTLKRINELQKRELQEVKRLKTIYLERLNQISEQESTLKRGIEGVDSLINEEEN